MDERSQSAHPLLATARLELGTPEILNGNLNPIVRAYFSSTRYPMHLVTKRTPWCAVFVCAMLARAGYRNPRTARAADFKTYGRHVDHADIQEGDILVLDKASPDAGGSGHVTIFAGFADGALGPLLGLGGNQDNRVCVKAYERARVAAVRRPELA